MRRKLSILALIFITVVVSFTGCSPEKRAQKEAEREMQAQAELLAELESNAKYYNEDMVEVSKDDAYYTAYYFDDDGTPLVGKCHIYLDRGHGYAKDQIYRLHRNVLGKSEDVISVDGRYTSADNGDFISNLTKEEVKEFYDMIKIMESEPNNSEVKERFVERFKELKKVK